MYKNVYYISLDVDEDNFNKLNNNEVSSIRWVNYYEAMAVTSSILQK